MIDGSGGVGATFTVPVGLAVIEVPAVMSGSGEVISCVDNLPPSIGVCPANAVSETFTFSIPGELIITIGAPNPSTFSESFTASFSGSVPEPTTIMLLALGFGVLVSGRVFRRASMGRMS